VDDPGRVVPPWAVPHIPDFDRIGRVVDLAPGFMLVPVETSGPDVARVLAAWLTASGRPVVVVEPGGDEAWKAVTSTLLDAHPDSAGAVLLIGTRESSPGLRAGLRLLNQRRDTLVEHLGRPLLWCGPKEFLDTTWIAAPDFWSIADVPRRFEAPAAVGPRPEAPAVVRSRPSGTSPERLRTLYEDAKAQGDRRNAARIGKRLAEALLDGQEYAQAEKVTREVLGLLQQVSDPDLERGAHEILGRILTVRGDIDAAEAEHNKALEMRRSAGDRLGAAIVLGSIARIRQNKGKVDEALRLHEEALKVYEALGDLAAVANARWGIGQIASAKHDDRTALDHFMASYATYQKLGDLRQICLVGMDLGKVLLAAGRKTEAIEILERSRDGFLRLGLPPRAQEVQQLLDDAAAKP
jgi:Tetratricopeptide repeat